MTTIALVRGTGDVGSAVAALLRRAGFVIVLHDSPAPAHTRRGMAFVDALYEGTARLEELLAKRARDADDLALMLRCGRAIPATALPFDTVLERARPQVLVDARMRKRDVPENQRSLAALTIGLGPNFEAGDNVDVAIETAWGDALGAVIPEGRTRALEGEPQPIGGHARERYVYAPRAGTFTAHLEIGERVVQGEDVGCIDDTPIRAPLSGWLRGLSHTGAAVRAGTKIVEVDPREDARGVRGLGERPRRIAEGVLKALGTSA